MNLIKTWVSEDLRKRFVYEDIVENNWGARENLGVPPKPYGLLVGISWYWLESKLPFKAPSMLPRLSRQLNFQALIVCARTLRHDTIAFCDDILLYIICLEEEAAPPLPNVPKGNVP